MEFHNRKTVRKLFSSSLNTFLCEKKWSIGGHIDTQNFGLKQFMDVFKNSIETYDMKVALVAW